ncbi:undecaprenyl-phosphate glucose phosphotransferase [Hyphomicrobium sp.]|uniref:undecaprenyl-phosphate glucose phosphotransferase n=1 Tax=Hyphomicrobium sp. TaxID=82 RepID=UPI000FB306C5|nr:undecaprenyl-phosphate glucose phosphotransferase [Hyphomicrobium sp.]RUO99046.1 MAG: undecaprenyl-phosphate glucose phosphotransferase [Hyphomicrobium sp.]
MSNKSGSAPSVIQGSASWGDRTAAWLRSFLFNRRGSASRPRLLFGVAAADFISVLAAWPLAHLLLGEERGWTWPTLWGTVLVAVLTIAALRWQWSYTIPSLRKFWPQVFKVLIAVSAIMLGVAGALFIFGKSEVSAREISAWMEVSALLLCFVRLVAGDAVRRLTRSGALVRRTVIVGAGKDAEELIQLLRSDPDNHMQILGIFDDRQGDRAYGEFGGIARLGTFADLTMFCRRAGVDLLIVTLPPRAEERLMHVLDKLFMLDVDVRISALNSKLRINSRAYSYIGRVPMLAAMDKSLDDWDHVIKNLEDRLIGSLMLLLAAPIMLIIAIAIRLDSKGPIFFRQKRYGFNNELIEVLKFRSMYVENQDATASKLVTRDDPRVTRVGRIIRRISLDELPQLINVVRGEMSLVGPRPHATGARADRDLYENVVQGYFARHRMKPGVTGWAQIHGWRGETDTHEKLVRRVEHDLYYIDHWSVLLDLYILAMTPVSLLTGKNAY